MADKFIEIKVEGESKIQAALSAHHEREKNALKELLNDLANVASLSLIAHAPQHSNYLMNHISREGPVWMPGGAGGDGEYKAIVGVKEGTSRHPLYVEFGTGIYAGRGKIFPTSGIVMTFQKQGEPRRFVRWTRGQRGQRYFYMTWRDLNAIVAARIAASRVL